MQRALIIGHTGQDGQILWGQLASRDFSLVGVSSRETCTRNVPFCPARTDISDFVQVSELVRQMQPDQIFYLAACHHSSQESDLDQRSTWRNSWSVHVHCFQNVLQAICEQSPQTRVFYASSSRVFGRTGEETQDETTPLKPECPYGVTKASAMMVANHFRAMRGLYIACGIMFNHESPLRDVKFVSQRVVEGLVSIKLGDSKLLEVGSLDTRVDWGYAPDYTHAMQLILESNTARDYVIASGETHSVRELVEIAADCLGLSWCDCVVESKQLLQRPPQALCGNASLLRSMTGWRPRVSFEEMVRIMVSAALERRLGRGGPVH